MTVGRAVVAVALPRRACAMLARRLSTTTTTTTMATTTTADEGSRSSSSSPTTDAHVGPDSVEEASLESAMTGRPPKFIPDHLTPMPSHLLATLLSDLTQEPPTSSPEVQRPAPPLPQGHHLVYFPTQTPPSRLAADGADRDHEPPRGRTPRRRLWAGGEVVFREGWRRALRLDARPWACREAVEGVRRAGDRVFVHVWRRYGAGHAGGREGWDIEERRTLAFVPSPVGEPAAAASASESSQPRRPPRTRTPFTPPPPPAPIPTHRNLLTRTFGNPQTRTRPASPSPSAPRRPPTSSTSRP